MIFNFEVDEHLILLHSYMTTVYTHVIPLT